MNDDMKKKSSEGLEMTILDLMRKMSDLEREYHKRRHDIRIKIIKCRMEMSERWALENQEYFHPHE